MNAVTPGDGQEYRPLDDPTDSSNRRRRPYVNSDPYR